ncbi:DNA polymerase beta domain protein region [Pyrolobus fumarii 1A]|uniref:DNA polymerase beta domain protein region n=1 Tax=Pyrolobus fumarii (strain DSM 11204 / 1A) TaxID=694429 RepID=G0EG10_PYRF1|nr:nucleotidyltransferase domain-containing protein [Pyrolobus fumarii]AEM39111.1 DNA polymerase beta domain protein region [Pyrolobus fumarii 1A]
MRGGCGSGRKAWPKILKSIKPSDEDLMLFVERVRERHPRSAILLFGSRARGDNLPYSDYDVAVILERVEDRLREAEELAKLKPSRLPLDLVVLELDDLRDPLIAKMLTPCKVLYDGLGLGELPCTETVSSEKKDTRTK